MEIGYVEDHTQIALDDQVELCPGEVIVLDATQSFEASYFWNTGSALPIITITTPGSYTVTVKTDCAEEIHVVSVSQNEDCLTGSGFYIPNVFSPNGDNINDQFIIVPGPEIEIVTMEGFIYDRWGGVMFQSESNPFTWDGRLGGEDVLPGVYIYRLKINYRNDGREYSDLLIGNVTVVR